MNFRCVILVRYSMFNLLLFVVLVKLRFVSGLGLCSVILWFNVLLIICFFVVVLMICLEGVIVMLVIRIFWCGVKLWSWWIVWWWYCWCGCLCWLVLWVFCYSGIVRLSCWFFGLFCRFVWGFCLGLCRSLFWVV